VSAALRWLGRHQSPDGTWSSADPTGRCKDSTCSGTGEPGFDEGVTSLALLAFLGAGYTQLSKDILGDPNVPGVAVPAGDAVKKGLQALITRQDSEGCIGTRGPKFLYNHAIATLALCEAYGMTEAPVLRGPAQKAVDFLVAAQNPGAGWRYGIRGGKSDTSVTGWAVMALKSAELSGLSFPRSAYDGALAWIDRTTERGPLPRVGYNEAGSGKVYIPGRNEAFADHPTMSAIGLVSRLFIKKDWRDAALASLLTADLPAWKTHQIDFYSWYYSTLALFQFAGPTGTHWTTWNEPMKNALIPNQKVAKHGCENGSWDPSLDRWGFEGGRVYATAINTMTLEIHYRYANAFGVAGR
jgi:hypothetical protein